MYTYMLMGVNGVRCMHAAAYFTCYVGCDLLTLFACAVVCDPCTQVHADSRP